MSEAQVDYRDCMELAGELAESIEKADGSWVYEGDDLPGQFVPHLMPVMQELHDLRERYVECRKVLLKLEWCFDDGFMECPICRNEKWKGHAADCSLAVALGNKGDVVP